MLRKTASRALIIAVAAILTFSLAACATAPTPTHQPASVSRVPPPSGSGSPPSGNAGVTSAPADSTASEGGDTSSTGLGTGGGSDSNVAPAESFSIQDSNTTTPDDVLKEVTYGGLGGGGGLCTKKRYKAPAIDQTTTSATVDWLAQIFVVSCGWKKSEQVHISVQTPDGRIIPKTVRAEADEAPGVYRVYLAYPLSIDDPPGSYSIIFQGSNTEVEQDVSVSNDRGPRMYYVDSLQGYYLYGFVPHERVRFFLYSTEEGPLSYSLTGWKDYVTDEKGHLLIQLRKEYGLYTAAGDISGPVGNAMDVLEEHSSACSGSLSTRLKVGDYAYVSENPPIDNTVREGPGTDQPIVGYIAAGHSMQVLSGPRCSGGYTWWKVQSTRNASVIGWSAEGGDGEYWLVPCESKTACP